MHTWGDAALEFVGSGGTIAIDYMGESMLHTKTSGPDDGVNTVAYGTDTTAGLIDDFVDAVREDRALMTTPDVALEAVDVDA